MCPKPGSRDHRDGICVVAETSTTTLRDEDQIRLGKTDLVVGIGPHT